MKKFTLSLLSLLTLSILITFILSLSTYKPTSHKFILSVSSIQSDGKILLNHKKINITDIPDDKYTLFAYDLDGTKYFQLTEYHNIFDQTSYYLTHTYTYNPEAKPQLTKADQQAADLINALKKVNAEYKQWKKENNYPNLD